ncbi:MAG: hypothetical protein IKZ42_01250 [Clostridiales bacterium]|nr:hypothetical protein [Clostridiales bacterium]
MRDTFDKVVMDETRREDIRAGLMKKRKAKKTWLAPVAAVAAAIAIIMIVPGTREFVVKAAETLYGSFRSSFNNLIIEIEETSYTEASGAQVYRVSTYYDFNNAEPWAQVKDGRLYFVLNGKWTDITAKSSATEYYTYEKKDENGYKTVLFVGGTPEDYGWGQLVWNPQGELIECMVVLKEENADPAWVKNLIKKESVEEFIITKFSIDDYSTLDMKAKTDTVVDYTGIVKPEN